MEGPEIVTGKLGTWGRSFDENKSPARRIRGDLDEVLACSIIPELWRVCKYAGFDNLTDGSHLIAVLELYTRHVEGDRTKPVPIAVCPSAFTRS